MAPHHASTAGRGGAEVPEDGHGKGEHGLAASAPAQTCKGNQVLNSYLGTSLPRKSEIEVRPLNISAGLAPRPGLAVRHGAVLSRLSHGLHVCSVNGEERVTSGGWWKAAG